MTSSQSIKLYEILRRYFGNDSDAKVLVEEIQQLVESKFTDEKKELSSKSEIEMLRKDVDAVEIRLSGKIENTALRTESNLKSEINKLIVWKIATMFGAAALFITIGKVFFDK